MIKKMKSRLSVKVFLITSIFMAACCFVTYFCIARFAPYIYSHDLADVEELADMLSKELFHIPKEEAQYFIQGYNDILAKQYDDEFVFHLFQNSGEEIALPNLDELTGNKMGDYKNTDMTGEYEVSFADSTETYILLLAKNTNKESQVVLALQKTLPILSVVILLVSVITAFFYTWYMTEPMKKINRLSKQIADMEMERRLEKQRAEFLAAASHELKTPITIIKGQLQGMLYQVGRYKDRDTYLVQSLEVTDTLEKMVGELLTISRLDTLGYICKKDNFNLSSLISDRLAAFEDLFMQKDLTVTQSISSEICILGDRGLIQKALDNLLGNAASYSETGNQIVIKLWKESEITNLTIENTGAHIPDEAIPKLFEPFYRVDQSRNRQTGGTGLGLYIVKTILDLHGANIEIANILQGVIVSVQFYT